MAASAVLASSTLPTPASTLSPKSRQTSAMTFSAFGVVMVISMPETPPSISARLASMSCSELSARMIATTPGVSRPSMIWSLVMEVRELTDEQDYGILWHAIQRCTRPEPSPASRRLDFGEPDEVEVAADGVLQAARRHGELDRVLRRFLFAERVNQARRERIAAADAVDDLDIVAAAEVLLAAGEVERRTSRCARRKSFRAA